MKKLLTTCIISLTAGLTAFCVPAFPGKVKILTEDRDTVEIFLKGDEHNKFAISMDGYILAPKNNSWYYLEKDLDSNIVISDISINSSLWSRRGEFVRADSQNIPLPQKEEITRAKRQAISGGESNALVILIEYPNKKFVKTKQEINDLFNKIGYNEDGAKGSVRDFYHYASYDTFDLVSDVYGPYMADYPMEFYGGNNAYGNDNNSISLAIEAISYLPDDIDLSKYDNDNDGIVDNVHIIFAGYGEEAGGPSSAIWSHEYPARLPLTKNGYEFAGYSCTPELRSNMGNGISRIGVICHELGHAFGANDFYDVDYSSNGSYEGTGVWDLMASGSWNGNGVSPANFNPYVKIIDFGWISPVSADGNGRFSLDAYNFSPTVLSLPTSNPGEYYLIEYRTRQYFDEALPGEGVLIYHVHSQIESQRASNTINNSHPQCFYPVCASGSLTSVSAQDYGDINSSGCPFPGSSSNTHFSRSTIPSAFQWDGSYPTFSITNIQLAGDKALLDINVDGPELPELPHNTVAFEEGFENSLNHFFSELIEGKAKWEIYPTRALSQLNDMPSPYEKKHALMLYAGKKSGFHSRSTLTSERIPLNADSTYVLSFYMRTIESPSSGRQFFNILIQDPITNKWENVYENSLQIDDWSEIKIPLPQSLSCISFRFSGEILDCGIFIDDIKINSTASTNLLDQVGDHKNICLTDKPFAISSYDSVKVEIFDLAGKLVYKYDMSPSETIMPVLNKGIYIVYTDKGDIYKIMI